MHPLIAAIYGRKSTEQGGADETKSVTRQVEHARVYAVGKGWIVDDSCIFLDDGISGAEFGNRPGFVRLMNALKPRPPFQVLIMSEESRLGREAIETAYALKQLVTAGVRVFFYLTDTERTFDSPTDKLLLSVTAFADEMERERARQRTYDALSRKARAGYVTGGRTFGYDNVRGDAGVRRVINPIEAAVVQRIYVLAAQGDGLVTIAKTLNAEGAPSPRPQQGRPGGWAPSSVREVLHRPLYCGEIVWNQTRKRDTWGVKRQAPKAERDWMRIAAPDLTIIDADLRDAAHQQMTAQRARYHRTTTQPGAPPWGTEARYLLTGLLRCTVCGSGLEARSRKGTGSRRVFYGCAAYHRRGTAVCDNGLTVPMETADTEVLTAVQTTLLHKDVIGAAITQAVARITQPQPVEDVSRELRAVEQELLHLSEAIAAGGDVPALLVAVKSRDARRRQLEARQGQRPAVVDIDADRVRADLEQRLDHWQALLQDEAPKARRLLKQLIVGRLDMTPDREDRSYRFRGIGTVLPVLEGVVPQSVASPPGPEVLWKVPIRLWVR